MRYLLLHSSAWDPASVGPALERAQIEARQARLPRDLAVDERPSVFVLDSESRSAFPLDVLRAFVDAGGAIVALGRNGEADIPAELPAELPSGFVRLRFRLAQTYSKPEAPFIEFTIPVDRSSLAGYAAVTGEPLVIDDAYFLPPDVEYSINRSFDERYGYRTKSMLVIPMKDHKEDV